MIAQKESTVTILVMTVAPAFDPVAWVNISMNGYPVGLFTAAVMSPMQNKTATIMANARTPLIARLPIIVHKGLDYAEVKIERDLLRVERDELKAALAKERERNASGGFGLMHLKGDWGC